jgi:secreted trypsin-like serine protease
MQTIYPEVARGKGCALYNVAGVYTRIKAHLEWLKANIKSGDCQKH